VVAAALDAETLVERLAHAHRASKLRHVTLGRPAEEIAMAAALGAGDAVERWKRKVRGARLEITGDDLLAAGVPEGPDVGRGLDAAWAALLDEGTRDRDAQLAAALKAAQ
jgi:tRNA nucleotidyltransferase (CCA-adding enzyme)